VIRAVTSAVMIKSATIKAASRRRKRHEEKRERTVFMKRFSKKKGGKDQGRTQKLRAQRGERRMG
jgi:hypothetical protein